ncbi:DUF3943 domain-containing protein [Microbacter margulisiae]|uniref:DUF3943 domain-containing protein n=1 Tax=Microbacter margulisiae TaxID=1350067 RepID=A0A7W5DQQ5_9PORP|nr:DUF3943 domain-containing protein [Microbacter margulisiae]MBB3187332.1 hypothetical protein [Microbacter margulisiae]
MRGILIFLLCACFDIGYAQVADTIHYQLPDYADSIQSTVQKLKKKPILAAAETFGLNMVVWDADYLSGQDFAKINLSTMHNNLKTGFMWDNDNMSTNLFLHPYSGSLSFTSARANGMNFWQSLPFSAGGSLMWECFMENQPPSTNDFLATTFGGAMLGEILYRLSNSVYDDSKTGSARVLSELAGFIFTPMVEFNRIISGEAFRVRHRPQNTIPALPPVHLYLNWGGRFISERSHLFQGSYGLAFGLRTVYGDPFDESNYKPYDWFTFNLELNVGGAQPVLNTANAVGLIWGKHVDMPRNQDAVIGIYQHFNFYDSDPIAVSGSEIKPYQVAETVSFGPGMLYKLNTENNRMQFVIKSFTSLVLLGATYTDHLKLPDREYNMGQGFSINLDANLAMQKIGDFGIKIYNLNLYTWKGYPLNVDYMHQTEEQNNYLNTEGDKGHSNLFIITPTLNLQLSPSLSLMIEQRRFIRIAHYVYYPNMTYATFDSRVTLQYKF